MPGETAPIMIGTDGKAWAWLVLPRVVGAAPDRLCRFSLATWLVTTEIMRSKPTALSLMHDGTEACQKY